MEQQTNEVIGQVTKIKPVQEFQTKSGKVMFTAAALLKMEDNSMQWVNVREFDKPIAEEIMKNVELNKSYQVQMVGQYKNVKEFKEIESKNSFVEYETEFSLEQKREYFETKDRRIVRQSCLGYAVQFMGVYCALHQKESISVKMEDLRAELFDLASSLETWVFR